MFARSSISARACTRYLGRLRQPQCEYLNKLGSIPVRQPQPQRSVSSFRVARERLKILYRGNPVTLPLALVSLAISFGFVGYVSYGYFFYIRPIDHNFPKAVAAKLKRGIYHTSLDPDLPKALKFFKQALVAAEEANMNPFSDEVIGIKLRVAQVLEENKQYAASIKVLEMLRTDTQRWLDTFGDREELKIHRTRLLRKVVQICVKLGQLYSTDAIDDVEEAERNLTEGVEITMREASRRDKNHVSEESEGPWLSNEEIGGTLEELAHHFDRKAKYSLSSPLFLRALTLNPPPCHAAMLMNNLSTSLAQTVPDPSLGTPTSRAALLSNATAWAEKAITVSANVKGEERTEECDVCTAVATMNLGEFAEMEGLLEKAVSQYAKASSLAKAASFTEGQKRADQALQRLQRSSK